jgi:hypothetical protein
MLVDIKFIAIFAKNPNKNDYRGKNRAQQANTQVRRAQLFHTISAKAAQDEQAARQGRAQRKGSKSAF